MKKYGLLLIFLFIAAPSMATSFTCKVSKGTADGKAISRDLPGYGGILDSGDSFFAMKNGIWEGRSPTLEQTGKELKATDPDGIDYIKAGNYYFVGKSGYGYLFKNCTHVSL
ncbi:hypothetical protein [Enterobacter ludwigii]|uniref:hypothetical protein n=1 Tax=Enterobacter ludwigii TaxID=299767 RepID=UPI0030767FE8|nr:hypothetical protein [Enterobacter ludwigii]HDR2600109.1 hypothetical protein [Enterobacter ludwigii]